MDSTPLRPHILMIDNYDSFTYNIVQYCEELGARVTVYRNDALTLDAVRALADEHRHASPSSRQFSHVLISPGPGAPSDAGISCAVIESFLGVLPIFGVCLGLQCMFHAAGGVVTHAGEIKHGKTSDMSHDGRGVFKGIPSPFRAVRYHSLAGTFDTLPSVYEVTATSGGGPSGDLRIIQGVRHKQFVCEGVQFHPESILTEHGHDILRNFVSQTEAVLS